MSFRLLSIVMALAIASCCLAQSPAAADRKTLVFQGRALDQDGFPVPGVRVLAAGTRQGQAKSDRRGEFSLSVSLREPAELERERFKLVVWAQREDWRFVLPSGDESVGLEIEVERVPDGAVRCVARSNEARVAASAARAVGMQGRAFGVATINFVGVRGPATDPGPAPKLSQTAKATLRGGSITLEPPQAEPAASPAPSLPRSEIAPPPALSRSEIAPPPVPDPIRPEVAPPEPTDTATLSVRPPTHTPFGLKPKPRRAITNVNRPNAKSSDARERAAAELLAREQALARIRAELNARPSSPELRPRATTPPPVRRPARARRDTLAPPLGASSRPPRDTLPTTAAAPALETRYEPRPQRSETSPLVIRALKSGTTAPSSDSCRCRIEGTVEVNSDRPLPGRLLVGVSLEWHPAITDTVEMFMGSPRRFELPPAPCGPQRIKVSPVARERYAIVSRATMIGFQCGRGEHRQVRIVLARE